MVTACDDSSLKVAYRSGGPLVLVRFRRAIVVVFLAFAVAVVGLVAPAGAARDTPVPFPRSPKGLKAPVAQPDRSERASGYFGQESCSPVPMRGVRKLRKLALRTYRRGHDGGIARSCVAGGTSEHKEGRAWDFMLNVRNRKDRRVAGNFLAWLTKRGPDGRRGVKARRLGVMYIIYNRRSWASYRPSWQRYTGSSPHTDHIHLSFSWAGARGRTSFWTGRVARTDYGPCQVLRRQPAVISRRANRQPCRAPARLSKKSYRSLALLGSSKRSVRVAQRMLDIRRSRTFDRRTWRAVKRYQRAHDLPVTGALDKPTWASLAPKSVRWSAMRGYGPRGAARYGRRHWSDERLRRGSAGRPVAFLQTALRMPHRDRNGMLGRHTARRLRGFKAAHGLARNARVNGRVWRALPARR